MQIHRLLSTLFPITLVVLICQTRAASVGTEEEFENFPVTNQYPKELPNDDIQELTTTPRSTTTTHPLQFHERYPKPIRLPHPFVLWWSSIVQSVPQLIRQRNQKSKTSYSLNPYLNLTTTTVVPNFSFERHDVNDIAAGLDILIPDSPTVFDQMPLD